MLTSRERDAYQFIQRYCRKNGYSPKLEEIAEGINNKSKGTVHRITATLVKEGLILIHPRRHRGISLVTPDTTTSKTTGALPLLGKIAAGRPIEAIEDQESINLNDYFSGEDHFALKVKGESMIDDGILDGDLVVIKYSKSAIQGKIVVALIENDEVTLKRIYYNNDKTVTLKPSNTTLLPITYPADKVQIRGVVVGQMRVYSN